jgi:predicted fused transcriptional regulator/phosphomethylpyrimidine kinase
VEIGRFVWTEHARMRLTQRGLDTADVEQAISSGHAERDVNDGRAEWVISGVLADGTPFEAIYDHPHGGDEVAVRIVSVWRRDS